ncbi:MAG: OmpA/MotB domain protein [Fluviicola sp.]|jgi:outer membrane protein OmpA-like peptidoglycan-associated protein/tetratricopeptide (TPR) repeat protein|uniref:OmpA family protein n=1 Tax=Fluviicola sp. TaxID=1917219 RepID=UPI00260EB69C|nr:OmpA family protein [Fluviicola sp.]MDF3026437.1 OmpA/MotB domain protein [Fluviicola sp.]
MKTILLAIICSVSLSVWGQSGKLKKADNYFNRLSYAYAAELYEELIGSEVDSPALKSKLAYSYLKMDNYTKSVDYYSKMITSSEAKPDDYYNYSQVLKQTGNYSESDKWMNKYSESVTADIRSQLFLSNTAYKSKIEKNQAFFSLENLALNTSSADFGGYYNSKQDQVYFITARKKRAFVKNEWSWDARRFLDLYQVSVSKENKLGTPERVSKVNTKFHEGPVAFAPDGKKAYFTRNNISSGSKRRDGQKIQNLKVYIADIDENGNLVNETEFPYNSKDYSVGHPTITADGKTMYLVSDKPGGIGGADIYKVAISDNGTFGEMINLGNKINTEGQEMFPFIDTEGRLFFSTDGHPGLGGLDVFVAFFDKGTIGKIHSLGLPVNSQFDDFAFNMSKDFKTGFLSSNRDGGKGGDDIYSVQLLRPFVFGVTIKGTAKDKKGGIVPFAKIDLKDDKGNIIETVTADENGAYTFEAEYEKNYGLGGTKADYFAGKNTASTFTNEQVVIADVVLEKDPGLSLYALITDKKTGNPLQGVKVFLVDNMTGQSKQIETPASGDFREALFGKKLNDRGSYNLVLQKEGYFSKTITYNTLFDRPGQYDVHGKLDLGMDPEVKDLAEMIQINPINFDLNKFNIRPDAAKELDKIVEVMNKYPYMVVELGSHTDCRASKAYNIKLSDKRAKASAEYIKKKITNPERIYGKGYGESRLLNGCECEGAVKSDCSEEEHQKNRRTEFKVISTGDDKLKVKNTSTDSF